MLALTLSSGEAILLIVLIAIPVGALTFAMGAGNALGQIGKGPLSIEQEMPQKRGAPPPPISAEQREAEIRQLLEAKAFRQAARGENPLDVDRELDRVLESERRTASSRGLREDSQLVAEVRELVLARNDRRVRMGREPLDVEAEIERQLDELESLGQ